MNWYIREKLLISLVIVFSSFLLEAKDRMKLYTFYTPSHEILFNQWFLPTLQDDFELVIEKHPQECATAIIFKEGWGKTMLRKVELILRGIRENWGKIFIYADIDIQFFKPIQKLVEQEMIGKDIVFQRNAPRSDACAGFIVCRANKRTKELFENVKRIMIETKSPSDQIPLNFILHTPGYEGVRWDFLPVEFFGGGTLSGISWNPGDNLLLPNDVTKIVLHHANWVRGGVKNKIKQFIYVRNAVNCAFNAMRSDE